MEREAIQRIRGRCGIWQRSCKFRRGPCGEYGLRGCFTVLPSLLAAAGVAALQAGVQRLRLLHVLRGLLLTNGMISGSGSGCRRTRFPMRRRQRGIENESTRRGRRDGGCARRTNRAGRREQRTARKSERTFGRGQEKNRVEYEQYYVH